MLLSKRRGFSRFVFLLHQLQPESQFLRHNHRRFVPEMAAAAAANVISSDLFQSKGFHFHPSAISASSSSELSCGFPFSGKYPISKRYCSGRTTSRSGCGCGYGGATSIGFAFTPKGCFDSDSHNRLPCQRSLHTNGFEHSSRRSNGFEHHKAQFFRDLELEEIPPLQDVRGDTSKLALNGREGTFQNGKPLGFPHHHLPRDKVVVAVDVDEVLGNFVSALNRFIADRYSLNHSVSEYHVYEFFKIWNCSRDEADIRVHEFFKTSYFKTGIHPIPGALEALHNLSRIYDLSVVTSRQNAIKDHTIEWIEKHYPGLFQEIHFGNHFALDGISRSKSEICRSLGAKVLIDDNPRYAIECAEVGIRVLLFDYENSYPWCKTGSINQHPLVTKVHNWEEVEQQLVSVVLQ